MPRPSLTHNQLNEILGPIPAVSLLSQIEEYRLHKHESLLMIAKRVFVREALSRAAGNQSLAAKQLGIQPCTLSMYLSGQKQKRKRHSLVAV